MILDMAKRKSVFVPGIELWSCGLYPSHYSDWVTTAPTLLCWREHLISRNYHNLFNSTEVVCCALGLCLMVWILTILASEVKVHTNSYIWECSGGMVIKVEMMNDTWDQQYTVSPQQWYASCSQNFEYRRHVCKVKQWSWLCCLIVCMEYLVQHSN